MTQMSLPTPLPDDTPRTDLWVEMFGETPAQQEQRIATLAAPAPQPKVIPCYCCGEPADGEPGNLRGIIVPLCKVCEGARFVVAGLVQGNWGWNSKHKVDKTAVLQCPAHGRQEHTDIDEDSVRWATVKRNGDLYPVRTTGGVLVYPLEWR